MDSDLKILDGLILLIVCVVAFVTVNTQKDMENMVTALEIYENCKGSGSVEVVFDDSSLTEIKVSCEK